jgi:hypothetical protein
MYMYDALPHDQQSMVAAFDAPAKRLSHSTNLGKTEQLQRIFRQMPRCR